MFASLNYSYECPKGLEHSDLGYECYADYDKKLHTELARPTMLYAGIGGLVGGVIIAKIGKDRLEKGTSVTITPNDKKLHSCLPLVKFITDRPPIVVPPTVLVQCKLGICRASGSWVKGATAGEVRRCRSQGGLK